MTNECSFCGQQKDSQHYHEEIQTMFGSWPIIMCPNMPSSQLTMTNDKKWLGYCIECDKIYFLPPGPEGCDHNE